MIQSAPSRRPWKAFAAAAVLLAAAHAASAAPAEAEAARVDVVAQMPLRDACPAADADLADALIGAWDDAAKPSAVAVTFKVQRHAVYEVAPQSGSARAVHQIRRAVHGLRCDGGNDEVHTVRFVVHFVDGEGDGRIALVVDDPSGR
jgi:hypothetical protein